MNSNTGSASIASIANQDEEREFVLNEENAAALYGGRRRRSSRRSRGGDNSGALLQLAAQSMNNKGLVDMSGAPLLSGSTQMGGATHKGGASRKGGAAAPLNNTSGLGPMSADEVAKTYADVFDSASKQLPLLQNLQQKGGNTGAVVNLASTRSVTTPGASAVQPGQSGKPMGGPAPVQGGRILLKPRKGKVSLKAPKKLRLNPTPTTRKAARKIKLGVKGLKTRLNRAKKVHSHAQTVGLNVIKQRLVKAGVIKVTSKAPEQMLRTMYADLLVTKKGL
jgi:hypothetical protein